MRKMCRSRYAVLAGPVASGATTVAARLPTAEICQIRCCSVTARKHSDVEDIGPIDPASGSDSVYLQPTMTT
jgi:hypothetical protein